MRKAGNMRSDGDRRGARTSCMWGGVTRSAAVVVSVIVAFASSAGAARASWSAAGPAPVFAEALSGSPLDNQTPYARGLLPGAPFCEQPMLSRQRPISLPADDAPHSRDPGNYWEWWYWRGHLRTTGPGLTRSYGFVTVYESKPMLRLQQTLATLADIENGKLHYKRAGDVPGNPEARINGFSLKGPYMWARGGGGKDRIHQEHDGYVLDLLLKARKPPVLLFGDGFLSAYCQDGFYYQRQRMTVRGRLAKNGVVERVRGSAWFDHFWGFAPGYQGAQTDYLQLELSGGKDVFLGVARFPRLYDSSSRLPPKVAEIKFGTIADREGRVTDLKYDDFTLTPTDYFRPTRTCSYPIGFDVDVLGQRYSVKPSLRDAEIRSESVPVNNLLWAEDAALWDGPGVVSGDASGEAWLDFVGYCAGR